MPAARWCWSSDSVVPAKAGTHTPWQLNLKKAVATPHCSHARQGLWVPAFAGMTRGGFVAINPSPAFRRARALAIPARRFCSRGHRNMFPKPQPALAPNSYAYESAPMVKPTGFREYDARWLFGTEINLMGIQALGMGLGALIAELGQRPEIVTGHDFRSYSASIKYALISGLLAAGCKVHDIGLAVTPMAYFAQFELDVPCVAMVTASHNDNGWTGVKMGANRPLTFGPDEMGRLKQIVLNAEFTGTSGGSYEFHQDFP